MSGSLVGTMRFWLLLGLAGLSAATDFLLSDPDITSTVVTGQDGNAHTLIPMVLPDFTALASTTTATQPSRMPKMANLRLQLSTSLCSLMASGGETVYSDLLFLLQFPKGVGHKLLRLMVHYFHRPKRRLVLHLLQRRLMLTMPL